MIYPLVPKIIATFDEVEMARNRNDGKLGALVHRLLDGGYRPEGDFFKVLLLSAPDAPETLKLDFPIPNDKRSKTGKPTAFTMGQRYVSSEALTTAKTTSALD